MTIIATNIVISLAVHPIRFLYGSIPSFCSAWKVATVNFQIADLNKRLTWEHVDWLQWILITFYKVLTESGHRRPFDRPFRRSSSLESHMRCPVSQQCLYGRWTGGMLWWGAAATKRYRMKGQLCCCLRWSCFRCYYQVFQLPFRHVWLIYYGVMRKEEELGLLYQDCCAIVMIEAYAWIHGGAARLGT
jgi:hypothetical protein